MATTYEAAATVTDIMNTLETGDINQATLDSIQQILDGLNTPDGNLVSNVVAADGSVPNGTQVAFIEGDGGTFRAPVDAPIVMVGAGTTLNTTFTADSSVEAIILSSAPNNKVVVEGDKDVSVTLGGGTGDEVTTGDGNDMIAFNGGKATITTSGGDNTIHFFGGVDEEGNPVSGQATVTTGDGADTFYVNDEGLGASIDAGSGFDNLVMGSEARHKFELGNDGQVIMHSANIAMKDMEVVVFDTDPTDGEFNSNDLMTVISDSEGDTLVARLYQIALGRQPFDGADGWKATEDSNPHLGGINYWMNEFKYDSLDQLVNTFLNTAEFKPMLNEETTSNEAYVNALFGNLNKSSDADDYTVVNTHTAAEYIEALENGTMSRIDVAWMIASSEEADQLMGIDGTQYVIQVDPAAQA